MATEIQRKSSLFSNIILITMVSGTARNVPTGPG